MAKRTRRRKNDSEKDFNEKNTKRTDTDKSKYAKNDASWYTNNARLALDAGRFSFTWPTGAAVNWDINLPNVTSTVMGAPANAMHLPGVMGLDFVPAYGYVDSAEDPINISSFNIYSFVRHANSGHSNYDHSDLMLYLMAMDNIYMLYQHYVRAYGLLRLFSQRNRNYPTIVFNALNLDYEDLLAHMSDFRYYINTVALRIGSFAVPATMPLFIRHMWMCSGVYADAPSIKSQLYLFRPGWIGKYEEKISSRGGYLMGDSTLTTTKCKFADLVALMEDLLGRVTQSEDCNIMSGDILKAYGADKLFKVSQISEDYAVEPVYNPEVLRQIQNATLVKTVSLDSYDNTPVLLYQDPDLNILKSALTISDNSVSIMGKRLLTGSSESPSPEEVLVNSRLMVTAQSYTHTGNSHSASTTLFDNPHYGTEIISNARLYDFDYPAGERLYYGVPGNTIHTTAHITEARTGYFNYHPLIGREIQTYSDNVLTATQWIHQFDVDDYALVDDHDVEKLHMTALLSLFDIPQLGASK